MFALCLDPGKLTGVCFFEQDEGNDPAIIDSLELNQKDTYQYIEKIFTDYKNKELKVICEDFIISQRTAQMKTSDTRFSLEIIGAVRYFCLKHKKPLVLQTPATMKKFFHTWSLKDFNMWTKGGEGHKRDAARHGVFYLLQSGKWDPPMNHTAKGDYENLERMFN